MMMSGIFLPSVNKWSPIIFLKTLCHKKYYSHFINEYLGKICDLPKILELLNKTPGFEIKSADAKVCGPFTPNTNDFKKKKEISI